MAFEPQGMGPGLGSGMTAQGTPPLIPGVTQMSPERWDAVQGAVEGPRPPVADDVGAQADQLPRLIAAQFSLLQQASELGPEAFEMVATMAITVIKQLKKQMGMTMPQGMAPPPQYTPPMRGGQPGPQPGQEMMPMAPGMAGERSALPFLSLLAGGGQL